MATKELVQTVSVGSGGVASIDFTSIPQTGTDLLLVFSIRNSVGNENARISLNSVEPTGRTLLNVSGGTTGTSSTGITYGVNEPSSWTANIFASNAWYISNYASSTVKLSSLEGVAESNTADAWLRISAFTTNTTSPVTSLSIASVNGNLVQYSVVSLYVITKGSGGATTSTT